MTNRRRKDTGWKRMGPRNTYSIERQAISGWIWRNLLLKHSSPMLSSIYSTQPEKRDIATIPGRCGYSAISITIAQHSDSEHNTAIKMIT